MPARGIRYKVIVTRDPEALPRDADGYCDPDKGTIAIGDHLSLEVQWQALLHEWVHAQNRHRKKEYEDEVLTDDLAVGVMELLTFLKALD